MHAAFDSTHESASKKGMSMTEQEERLAKERKEIAARVASFKATQEKFEREREEFFITTLQNARGIKPIPFWS
jgi:chorismate mutase